MLQYVTSKGLFYCSNPNGLDGGSFHWPPATASGKEYYVLDVNSMKNPSIHNGPRTEYCAFWDYYMPSLVHGTGMSVCSAVFASV